MTVYGGPTELVVFSQTRAENVQFAMRCTAVSEGCWQRGHKGLCGICRLARLSAVRHFPFSRIQAKALAHDAALALQMTELSLDP